MKSTFTFLLEFQLLFSSYLFSQVPGSWVVLPNNYNYSMTITAKANVACVDLMNDSNVVAVVVGSECRGLVTTNTTVGSSKLGLLVVYSNSSGTEYLHFKIYNNATNTVYNVLDSILFNNGDQVGGLVSPYMMYTNHAPTDIAISNTIVFDHTTVGTTIATLSATDQDLPSLFNFTLTLGAPENSDFNIIGNELRLIAHEDHDIDSLKTIEITVDDNAGCSYTKQFTIRIVKIDDAPTDIIIDTLSLFENNENNFHISNIKTVDMDVFDIHIYTLVSGKGSGDNGEFQIIGNSLQIIGKANYDAKEHYYVRIRTTDAVAYYFEKAFVITVINNEGVAVPLPLSTYISPNGDGKNDLLVIDNVEIYNSFSLQILDQYGDVVYFKENNYANDWDGRLNGKALPTGNYYYIFKNSRKTYKGNITIMN